MILIHDAPPNKHLRIELLRNKSFLGGGTKMIRDLKAKEMIFKD